MNARSLYERFKGLSAKKVLGIGIRYGSRWLTRKARLNIDIPEQLAVIGKVTAIDYDAIYDRKFTPARHAFSPSARPLLVVGTQRGQVFLVGTDYRFTDRGFIDFDASGRAIEYDEKTGKITFLKD
jgi:hypothetical protein